MQQLIFCWIIRDAPRLGRLFLKMMVHLNWIPATIVSNWKSQITSVVWKGLCNLLGIKWRLATAFYPTTHRQTEWMTASMETHLQVFFNHQQDIWKRYLPMYKLGCHEQDFTTYAVYTVFYYSTNKSTDDILESLCKPLVSPNFGSRSCSGNYG